MMNERGFITLTAMLIMLMIATTLTGLTTLATRQSQIVGYSQQETKLFNAADSAFHEVVAHLAHNHEYYGAYDSNNFKSFNLTVNNVTVKIFLYKYEKIVMDFPADGKKMHVYIIMIRSLATIPEYNSYPIYKRVYGYMKKFEILNGDNEVLEGNDKYEFKEYLD